MKLNVAANLLTKDVKDLALGELVHISVVIGIIVLAVVLSFGVKTYLHWRAHRSLEEQDEAQEENVDLVLTPMEVSLPAQPQRSGPSELRQLQDRLGRAHTVRHALEDHG